MKWFERTAQSGTFSNDAIPTIQREDPSPWVPGQLRVVGDDVYDGEDKLLTIPNPQQREEFVLDYETAPDDQKVQVYNEWRNKLQPDKGAMPVPEPKAKGGEDREVQVSTDKWTGRAYSTRVFVPGKEPKKGPIPAPGKDKDKPGSIPVYVRGIEMTYIPTGETIKFPYTQRGGEGSFGDSRPSTQTVKPRYKPSEMIQYLAKWVGEDKARELVGGALG